MAGSAQVKRRVARVVEALQEERLDGLLLTTPANITYLSGFRGEDSALLVTARGRFLVTDGRYTEEAERECPEAQVVEHRKGLMRAVAAIVRRRRLGRLGFEEMMPHGWYLQLRSALGARRLVTRSGLVERLRQVKDRWELAAIRRAVRAAEAWWSRRRTLLAEGRSEAETAAALVSAMTRSGAEGAAFPTIVAVGARGSLPHARSGGRRLRRSQPLLVDWGAEVAGYKSDLTRVFAPRRMSARFREVYRTVLEAQEAAIAAVRPGAAAGSVDRAARSVIARAGYAEWFRHSLGHGLGLEVHELPRIRQKDRTVLEPGMVFTIEPGIYLPGRFGVRIEDVVLVTGKGCEVLSSLPRSLEEVTL